MDTPQQAQERGSEPGSGWITLAEAAVLANVSPQAVGKRATRGGWTIGSAVRGGKVVRTVRTSDVRSAFPEEATAAPRSEPWSEPFEPRHVEPEPASGPFAVVPAEVHAAQLQLAARREDRLAARIERLERRPPVSLAVAGALVLALGVAGVVWGVGEGRRVEAHERATEAEGRALQAAQERAQAEQRARDAQALAAASLAAGLGLRVVTGR